METRMPIPLMPMAVMAASVAMVETAATPAMVDAVGREEMGSLVTANSEKEGMPAKAATVEKEATGAREVAGATGQRRYRHRILSGERNCAFSLSCRRWWQSCC